jgi:diguanylate cyclase (GGDEF)-like protein/PAS domain S-box-containing protein
VVRTDGEAFEAYPSGPNRPYGPLRRDGDWSLRQALAHPVNLVTIPVGVVLALGRQYGFVADVPMWVLIGALMLAHLGSMVFGLMYPGGSARAKPAMHLGIEMALIGVVIYATGWGAVLSIGFIFSATGHMGIDGSRIGRPAIIYSAAIILTGEILVALGWVPTLLSQPQGHGLAILEATGVSAVIWIMSFTQREKEAAELYLRRSEERLSALVQHASDAILVLDGEGSVIYASPAVQRLLGYPAEEFRRFTHDMLHPGHSEHARAIFEEVLTRPGGVTWIELPVRHIDGDYHWFEIGVTNLLDDPAVRGLVLNMRDVTERRSAQEQLRFQAHHDALTRLPNRWLFLEQLERAQRAARDTDQYVAVLFLDVDRFKLVNDSLGHEVGDHMLVNVAERLMQCLRPEDVVARFGGDEFTVLLTDLVDVDTALRVADRIIEALRVPLTTDGHELFLSASVGLALSKGGQGRASELLREADLAMYVAKEKGRNRWELFDPSLAPQVMERLELEGDLWRALEHGELIVQFQPEVSLKTGRVGAAETLVRWVHPRRGLLEPASFVPFAEESSLIVAIDRLVLHEACRWARRWQGDRPADDPLIVSVNLSPRFMRQADMVADVTAVLRESGVDPRCMQIEITERSALTDIDATCSHLHQLRAIGVRVAVDDFGTGYSSLSYLKQLPIDVLKLDKSFVDGLDAGPSDVAIVQAIVTMGHALGVKVTAEGVERPEQAARLRDLGCDAAMGWLWSQALAPEQFGPAAENGFLPEGGTRRGVVVPLRARG